MRLTLHSDYSLRVLLYLAYAEDRIVGTEEISSAYGISRHHLVRVVQTLADFGYIHVKTGRGGGASLARPTTEIRVGQVVRDAEQSFRIVECFDREHNTCPIINMCGLKKVLEGALNQFFEALDQYTLADICTPKRRDEFFRILGSEETPPEPAAKDAPRSIT